MLYDVYKYACSQIVQVFNWHVPWSASVSPTIGEVFLYALVAGIVIIFIQNLKY